MNQSVVDYLRENKDKYSKDVLVEQIKKVGYSENEVNEGVGTVFNGNVVDNLNAPKVSSAENFWDFKAIKVYSNYPDKWKDFLFGLLGPIAINISIAIVFQAIPASILTEIFIFYLILNVVTFLISFMGIFYLLKKRKFISYGLIAYLGLVILFIGYAFVIISAINSAL